MKNHPHLTDTIAADIRTLYATTDAGTFATPALMTGDPVAASDLVTFANWMTPPFNRWGMHHVRQLTATTPVYHAPVAIPATYARQDVSAFTFNSIGGETVTVAQHLAASRTDAFLVMQHGRILHEEYFNGQRPQDAHIIFSITKSLTGILAESLIAEGRLDDATRVESILPELRGSAFADASVRQLLDMTVGIDYDEVYEDPASTVCQFFYAGNYLAAAGEFDHTGSLCEFLPTLQKKGEHGAQFHYVTAVTEVLGWLIERISGRTAAERLSDIWAAIGCEQDGAFITDAAGRSSCGAGFNATLRDMGRFGNLILNKGHLNGQQIVPQAAIDNITCGADAGLYARDEEFSFWSPGASYRSQWYVYNDDRNCIFGCGIHGQYLFIDFASGVVIVKQSSQPTATPESESDTVLMLRAIARTLEQ